MSTFRVPCIKVGPITKHSNADTLGITQADGFQTIVRLGEIKEGELAVYIPAESMINVQSKWALNSIPDIIKDTNGRFRVRAVRLRKEFSEGILIPIRSLGIDLDPKEGDDLATSLDILKHEEPQAYQALGTGDNEKDGGLAPVYTGIERLERNRQFLPPDTEVVVSEKIHGCNARYCFKDGRLWVYSHRCCKKEPAPMTIGRWVRLKEFYKRHGIKGIFKDFRGFIAKFKKWVWHLSLMSGGKSPINTN